jgi:hypothetical protein
MGSSYIRGYFYFTKEDCTMQKLLGYSLCIMLLITSCRAGDRHDLKFVNLSHSQIDSLLTVTAARNMTITERMHFYSDLFLGMPYDLVCSGDGVDALYESKPLVNFHETNCMVYCEHVLALSISDSWDNFFNNLQQIRYKDGIIGMRTRNHYTMADWLPENFWLLEDATAKVAGPMTRQVTRTISHKKFFAGKGITDMRYVLPDRVITIDYVPKEDLMKIAPKLKDGDIGALIFDNKDDIFSAHMFMFYIKDGTLVTRESSSSKMTTFETPYPEWAEKIRTSKQYIGISLMRVRDDLNTPGKIILPWEIAGMKGN